jgi:hypothetical protein
MHGGFACAQNIQPMSNSQNQRIHEINPGALLGLKNLFGLVLGAQQWLRLLLQLWRKNQELDCSA